MKLSNSLSLETLSAELKASDQMAVLSELSSLLVEAGKIPEGIDLPRILKSREDLGSTGIGEEVAIPHVRLKDIEGIHMAVGRSKEGVDFNAIDGRPVKLFILLVAPEKSAGDHLKALAKISRLIKKPNFKQSVMEARNREEILGIIEREDEQD